MRIQFAGNGNGNEYVRDAGAEVEAEVEAVAEAVAVVEDEAAFSERTLQRADGCLYPIAAMPFPPRHSSPPAPFPLTHARVISVFFSLSLFSLLTRAAICGDRSGVWDRN